MTGTARSQYAIDLDEIERQIREASSSSTRAAAHGDPLTELARIVETSPQPSRAPRFAPPPSRLEPPAPVAPESTLPSMPRRSPDELEAAMRSLDDFFRNERPPNEPVAAPAQPADDPYGDWDLRGAAITPGVQEPRYDFEENATASGHILHEGFARAAAPADVDDGYWDEPAPQAAHQAAPFPPAKPSRRPMILAAAVLGVAVIGVAGALSLRGAGGKAPAGAPPIIKAESGPSKVAPANPGGLEIPDQDIQILQRSPARAKSVANVVNNEEEPVDLREAVRREAAASGQSSPARPVELVIVPPPPPPLQRVEPAPVTVPAVVTPTAAAPPVPAAPDVAAAPPPPAVTPSPPPASNVPEPRRVKTVAIKPPDPPAPPAPPPPAPVAVAPVAVAPAAPIAPPPVTAPAPPAVVAATPPEPPPPAASKPKVQGSIRDTTGTVRPAAPAANAPPLQITPAPSQVASLGRDPLRASTPPAPPPFDPPAEPRPAASPGGSFVVQLTSEGSEQSARAAIGRAQGRFSELSSYSSSIQRKEVKGQMRYRVRFGSMSRADANGLCATLKGKGQDCIIQAQ